MQLLEKFGVCCEPTCAEHSAVTVNFSALRRWYGWYFE